MRFIIDFPDSAILQVAATFKTAMGAIADSVDKARFSFSDLVDTIDGVRHSVKQLAQNAQGLSRNFAHTASAARGSLRNIGQDAKAAGKHISSFGKTVSGLKIDFSKVGKSAASSLSNMASRAGDVIKQVGKMNKLLGKTPHNINTINIGGGGGGKSGGGGIYNTAVAINPPKKKKSKLEKYGEMAMDGLAGAGMAAGRFAFDQGKQVLQSGMQASATKQNYKTMAGDAQGEAVYKGVEQYAGSTMYGTGLYKNAEEMLKLGTAAEQVVPAMRMLGEIAAGNQEKMDMLSVAFGETAGAGKLTEAALEKFKEAGFDPLSEIAKKTGESYDSLEKKMKSGGITATQVQGSMIDVTSAGGQYNGALAKAAATPAGKMTDIQNSVEESKMGLGVALEPAMNSLLSSVQAVTAKLPELLGKLVPVVTPLLSLFGQIVPAIMEPLGMFFELLQPIFDLLGGEAVAGIISSVLSISGSLMQVLKPTIEVLSWVFGLLLNVVNAVLEVFASIYKAYANMVGGIWKSVKGIFGGKDERPKLVETTSTPASANGTAGKPEISEATKAWSDKGLATKPSEKSYPSSPSSFAPAARPDTGQITGGGQKVVRISFRSVVEKMYNTVADTNGLVSTIEPRLDEAINRILAGVS